MANEEENEAAEATEVEEEQATPEEKKPSNIGNVVVIVIGFLVMTATPLISYLVVKGLVPPGIEEAGVVPKKAGTGESIILDLAEVRVNIKGTKATRVVMLKAHLVLSTEKLATALRELKPMLADKIATAASRRTVNELEGPEARLSLKRDIISDINAATKDMMSGAVTDVYFSEFLIQ